MHSVVCAYHAAVQHAAQHLWKEFPAPLACCAPFWQACCHCLHVVIAVQMQELFCLPTTSMSYRNFKNVNVCLLYSYSNSNSRPQQPAAGLCFGQVRTCNTVNCCHIAAALLFHYCCTDAAALLLKIDVFDEWLYISLTLIDECTAAEDWCTAVLVRVCLSQT